MLGSMTGEFLATLGSEHGSNQTGRLNPGTDFPRNRDDLLDRFHTDAQCRTMLEKLVPGMDPTGPRSLFHGSLAPVKVWIAAVLYFLEAGELGLSAGTLSDHLMGHFPPPKNAKNTASRMLWKLQEPMALLNQQITLEGDIAADRRPLAYCRSQSAEIEIRVEVLQKGLGRMQLRCLPAGLAMQEQGLARPMVDGQFLGGRRKDPISGLIGRVTRVLHDTHGGSVGRVRLQGYLDEFAFRFNHRGDSMSSRICTYLRRAIDMKP